MILNVKLVIQQLTDQLTFLQNEPVTQGKSQEIRCVALKVNKELNNTFS